MGQDSDQSASISNNFGSRHNSAIKASENMSATIPLKKMGNKLASIESQSSENSLEKADQVPKNLSPDSKKLFEGIAGIEEESNETSYNRNDLFMRDQRDYMSSKDESSMVRISPAKQAS